MANFIMRRRRSISHSEAQMELRDAGGQPFVCNLAMQAEENSYFRTALWTGAYLQSTLMSIPRGGEIGEEIHEDTEQVLLVISGHGAVYIYEDGCRGNREYFAECGTAVFIPRGVRHNIRNIGKCSLQMVSFYAPPHHPKDVLHKTKAEADAAAANE